MKTKLLIFLSLGVGMAYGQQVDDIHKKAIVIDMHNDVLSESVMKGKDITKSIHKGHTDLPRLKKGGIDVQFFSVWCDGKKKAPFAYANKQIDALNRIIKKDSGIVLGTNMREIEKGIAQDKLVAMIGVEGGHMIENRLDYIDSLHRRGVNYLTLTWNNSTDWASSAADESRKNSKQLGLSDFGKKVVERMNKLGMMIDLSHVGEQTFYDVLAISTKPVVVSHSDVYQINPHYRNLKDEQIKAIAKNDGVIGVNFYSDFLDPSYRRKVSLLYAKYVSKIDTIKLTVDKKFNLLPQKAKEELRPSLSLIVDHISYLVKLAGIDHVGLGADFDGMESTPIGLNDVADYPNLTEVLIKCGYNEEDIYKILGGNILRVIKAQQD
ncbi:dipeptidase [Olivibacter domesticus]|uniref:Membrane dipeptidase n=1 Tax=Olivibacter domesticus TaxID=407022 RepID=A0A1H7SRJ8_OLID1|nr:dipeptidase [Olivibacter domesticus]SEL75143.1 membrane dipeptidase [Olivibacter domesticus]